MLSLLPNALIIARHVPGSKRQMQHPIFRTDVMSYSEEEGGEREEGGDGIERGDRGRW